MLLEFISNRKNNKNKKVEKEMADKLHYEEDVKQLIFEAKHAMQQEINKEKQDRILEIKSLMNSIEIKFSQEEKFKRYIKKLIQMRGHHKKSILYEGEHSPKVDCKWSQEKWLNMKESMQRSRYERKKSKRLSQGRARLSSVDSSLYEESPRNKERFAFNTERESNFFPKTMTQN